MPKINGINPNFISGAAVANDEAFPVLTSGEQLLMARAAVRSGDARRAVIGFERSASEPVPFEIQCDYVRPWDFYLELGTGDQQRTERNLEEEQYKTANDSTAIWIERSCLSQVCGQTRFNAGTTFTGLTHYPDYKMSGQNPVTYFDSNHIFFADAFRTFSTLIMLRASIHFRQSCRAMKAATTATS